LDYLLLKSKLENNISSQLIAHSSSSEGGKAGKPEGWKAMRPEGLAARIIHPFKLPNLPAL
jgi:hypothetical protein